MITEALFKINRGGFQATIVENVETKSTLPFQVKDAQIESVKHDDWSRPSSGNFIIGVYRPAVKEKVFEFFKSDYQIEAEHYFDLIYQDAEIAETAAYGKGVFINPNVVVAPYTRIGKFVTVNRKVSVGHHTVIGDFCTINPGVNVAGSCNIEKNVTIGMGSNILDGVSIGENTVIGAGSLVTKDLPANVVAYGSPAKVIKQL